MTTTIEIHYPGPVMSVQVAHTTPLLGIEVAQHTPMAIDLHAVAPTAVDINFTQPIAIEVGLATQSSPTTWDYYLTNWTTAPAQIGTIAAGAVYSYTLTGTTRYRLVPSPYVAAQDAFYSAWDGAVLSGLVVSRG